MKHHEAVEGRQQCRAQLREPGEPPLHGDLVHGESWCTDADWRRKLVGYEVTFCRS